LILREALDAAAGRFEAAGCDTPMLDAEVLLGFVLRRDRAGLVARRADSLGQADAEAFAALCQRRLDREPVSHLIGVREFYGRSFVVNSGVLAPRPETELLVETALEVIDAGALRVVDVGTGSGAVALTLALERSGLPGLQLAAFDLSREALRVAASNAETLLPAAARLPLVQGDLLEACGMGGWDLVVSNPPYIRESSLADSMPELAFEPKMALVGGDCDGLGVIRRLVKSAWAQLSPGGSIVFEIGADQGAAAAAVVSEAGFRQVVVLRDLAGHDRVVRAEKIAQG
jgi:release factor glutamine methyltransferase